MVTTFYFLRIDGVDGNTFVNKRNAVRQARRVSKKGHRVSVWFRDAIGQHIPVNWRGAK